LLKKKKYINHLKQLSLITYHIVHFQNIEL